MRWLLALAVFWAGLAASATEPTRWRFDPEQSQARFEVTLRLPIHAEGRFKTVQGEIDNLPGQKLSVRVHLNSRELHMGGPEWLQKVTESKQFLNSAEYPDIDFQSTPFSLQMLTSGGEINGRLTIKDISRDVVFVLEPTQCRRPGFGCAVRVGGQLNRRDFAMTAYKWSLRDEVRFSFQLKFTEND